MDADIFFFSRTGYTRIAAEMLAQALRKTGNVNLTEIKTKKFHSYFFWLVLSCLPGCGVKIIEQPVLRSGNIFICFPKWTLNCPPITDFLRKINLTGKTVYLLITYGGFDEKRYAEAYTNKVKKACNGVKGVLLLKRREIQQGNFAPIKDWAAMIFN